MQCIPNEANYTKLEDVFQLPSLVALDCLMPAITPFVTLIFAFNKRNFEFKIPVSKIKRQGYDREFSLIHL